jgi:hypothetical protein
VQPRSQPLIQPHPQPQALVKIQPKPQLQQPLPPVQTQTQTQTHSQTPTASSTPPQQHSHLENASVNTSQLKTITLSLPQAQGTENAIQRAKIVPHSVTTEEKQSSVRGRSPARSQPSSERLNVESLNEISAAEETLTIVSEKRKSSRSQSPIDKTRDRSRSKPRISTHVNKTESVTTIDHAESSNAAVELPQKN